MNTVNIRATVTASGFTWSFADPHLTDDDEQDLLANAGPEFFAYSVQDVIDLNDIREGIIHVQVNV